MSFAIQVPVERFVTFPLVPLNNTTSESTALATHFKAFVPSELHARARGVIIFVLSVPVSTSADVATQIVELVISEVIATVPSLSGIVHVLAAVIAVVNNPVNVSATLRSHKVELRNVFKAVTTCTVHRSISPPHDIVSHFNHVVCVESAKRACPSVHTGRRASTVL